MRRESLRAFFDSSPTARLLRADKAPLIIDFLNTTFKLGETISVGQQELRSNLASYLEEIHETEPSVLPGSPERYLAKWTENGWLQRFLEASSAEPQYQLTRYAEDTIQFVDSAISKSTALVGTESRLRLVIDTLEDIVRGASADPSRRLNYLYRQQQLIDDEIEAIKSGKSVQVYKSNQIRERFQTAVDLLRALQSDFRAVEERFQTISRDVQFQQAQGQQSRGGILGLALDAEDLLKRQDEGISFFAFVAFLISPSQQNALRKTIEEIQHLSALLEERESLARVRRMVPALLSEADKVMKTTARLSSTLKRLLDAHAAEHRARITNVLRDIKQSAMAQQESPPEECTISIETTAEISSPMSRTFWRTPTSFDNPAPQEHIIDLAKIHNAAGELANLQRLDFRRLRETVRNATSSGDSLCLGQIIGDTPVNGGVVELLGYLQIAHDDGHDIDADQTEIIQVDSNSTGAALSITVPMITFRPKAKTTRISGRPK